MLNKVQLITYANRLGDGTIESMTEQLRSKFAGAYEGVHILPFFTPFDGADAGFDPMDHTAVDPRLGSWDDVAELSKTHSIMVDAIVNHVSWKSAQFQDVLAKGEDSPYYPMFLTMSSIFPDGATEEDLTDIYRPRPGLPFTHYNFNGKTRLVWTTFTPQQVDVDTDSDAGWAYLMSILDKMGQSHVSSLRLDAVGYGAKEAGSSCFMTPKTFQLIGRLREEAAKRGLEILIEVHSYYKKQVEIASKVDWVYDFALPPLLLHSLFTGSVDALAKWVEIRPTNAVTVLDTHDGIGVIDIGPDQMDRSKQGLVDDEAVDRLVETIHERTHGQSAEATGAAASNLDLYQVNSTFYSALGADDEEYLAARAVQFFLPGVPQVYYVGALAGENDMELLKKTNNGRDINRHFYTSEEIDENLRRPVVRSLNALCRLRNTLDAFDGEFSYEVDGGSIALAWSGERSSAKLTFTPGDHARLSKLEWSDESGIRSSDDLLSNPPQVD
jgi:sucrose phosphorylase